MFMALHKSRSTFVFNAQIKQKMVDCSNFISDPQITV